MEPFVHLPEYQLVICKRCQHAVLAGQIERHLQIKHKFTKESREGVIKSIREINGLISTKDELAQLPWPDNAMARQCH